MHGGRAAGAAIAMTAIPLQQLQGASGQGELGLGQQPEHLAQSDPAPAVVRVVCSHAGGVAGVPVQRPEK